jgi:hypothetical protein
MTVFLNLLKYKTRISKHSIEDNKIKKAAAKSNKDLVTIQNKKGHYKVHHHQEKLSVKKRGAVSCGIVVNQCNSDERD